jgi:hypothetical protein
MVRTGSVLRACHSCAQPAGAAGETGSALLHAEHQSSQQPAAVPASYGKRAVSRAAQVQQLPGTGRHPLCCHLPLTGARGEGRRAGAVLQRAPGDGRAGHVPRHRRPLPAALRHSRPRGARQAWRHPWVLRACSEPAFAAVLWAPAGVAWLKLTAACCPGLLSAWACSGSSRWWLSSANIAAGQFRDSPGPSLQRYAVCCHQHLLVLAPGP